MIEYAQGELLSTLHSIDLAFLLILLSSPNLGHDGALKTTETWFYLLDALPLWICMTLFCVIWPPRVIDGVEAGDASEALPVISRRSPWQRVHGEDVGMQKLPSGGSYSY